MEDTDQTIQADYVELAADIVSAYVSNNSVPVGELGNLLSSVHAALSGIAGGSAAAPKEEPVEKPTPAQIRKSITHDGLVSFVDGKTYKTLKRHLTGAGLDPASYRQRYGLPSDYPMTAPSYSEQRSALAKSLGLGQQRRAPGDAKASESSEPATEQAEAEKPRRVGRPRKVAAAE
ncbi:MucR family transcriptional regulator [Methylobacterium sp. Leaf399]|uniref:MucR family transcriptional regulator n=1 Tax=unclassified Methylobacterium TaxID=2615210 RepID=UPI0006F9851C|nr:MULTISPECIES: MucR family transcriptional regulator [unclassified Methylobacterium]KQP59689.1 MucR family transcriptional regulator [Methylobacterium sp. Leaf108]KQT19794.1 MucR family transcriptional regulator [Methylobacterium sp. Leaf399]KQT83765.1 MucR family transcriptional regulator [Methylobacterium sp. Leaf466]